MNTNKKQLYIGMATAYLCVVVIGSVIDVAVGLSLVVVAGALLVLWTIAQALAGKSWAVGWYLIGSIFIYDAQFRVRDIADESIDWQVILKILLWIGAMIVGAANLRRYAYQFTKGSSVWLLVFIAVAISSVVYSVDPLFSAVALFGFIATIALVGAAASVLSEQEIVSYLTWGLLAICVVSMVSFVVLPGMRDHQTVSLLGFQFERLGGVHHTNNIGRAASIVLGLLAIKRIAYKERVSWFILVFTLVALAWTTSRTAMLGLGAAVFLVLTANRKGASFVLTVLVLTISIFVLANSRYSADAVLSTVSRSGSAEEIYTATGRLYVWNYALQRVAEAPWFGHGFGSTGEVMSAVRMQGTNFTTNHPHNLFLSVIIMTGLVGFVPFVMLIIGQLKSFWRRPNKYIDFLLLFTVISGLFETVAMMSLPSTMLIVWLTSLVGKYRYTSQPNINRPTWALAS